MCAPRDKDLEEVMVVGIGANREPTHDFPPTYQYKMSLYLPPLGPNLKGKFEISNFSGYVN